ncbi:unnamed protein product [Rotaria sp. Silwood2]|nr:unnamed protein product [Rotaria sp. Silwood2]
MSNLEKLDVYLSIFVLEKFIDENNLKKNILNRMSQLNQFSFHIRSYITNHFPGGLYPYVRVVLLYDEYPFEHEFLNHFPFMENLTLINRHAQNYKQSYKLMNDNQNLSIVKYCYLTELDIR